jgi:hypothetical protein
MQVKMLPGHIRCKPQQTAWRLLTLRAQAPIVIPLGQGSCFGLNCVGHYRTEA